MAVYWRCGNCRAVNSEEIKNCKRCGHSEVSGYEVQVMIGGTLIRRSFKKNEYNLARSIELELKKKQELARIVEKLKGVDDGLSKLLGDESFQKGNFLKLKLFWPKYFQWVKANKKWTTLRERVYRWRMHIAPFFGEKVLAEITPSLVEKYKLEKLREGLSPASVNRNLAMLRHMLSMAVKWGYLKEHPLKGKIEMLRERKDRWTFITYEQYLLIREKLSEVYLDLYDFLVFTGARLGEALSLRWKDVIWDAGVAYLGDSKANRPRVIYLSDYVLEILKKRKEKEKAGEDERVFRHSDSEFRRAFKRALKEAGLPETIRVHDLRHTFASWLAMRGEPLQHIKELLGHSQISTTLRYAHLMPQVLRKAVNQLTPNQTLNQENIIRIDDYRKRQGL